MVSIKQLLAVKPILGMENQEQYVVGTHEDSYESSRS